MKKLFLILISLFFITIPNETITKAQSKDFKSYHIHSDKGLTIILHKIYVNGEVIEEIYLNQHKTINEVKRQFRYWKIVEENDDEIVLMKKINDLSPTLKSKGYFGISEDGMLSLYIGMPSGNNIIDSFFKIDTNKLEVYKQKQLERGIKVSSKKRYDHLLKDLKEYARRVN